MLSSALVIAEVLGCRSLPSSYALNQSLTALEEYMPGLKPVLTTGFDGGSFSHIPIAGPLALVSVRWFREPYMNQLTQSGLLTGFL